MEREFRCPSCGASNKVTNPGILMRICDYCRTAMYWDKNSALRQGKKSPELPPSTRFRIGSGGKLKGMSFHILGRLCYAHENGSWTEWFIETQQGKIMWLTEDEGELFLESSTELTDPAPAFHELTLGTRIAFNEKVGFVEEIGRARCLGGEGQIPFQIEVGEEYAYADGATADGSTSFGLEYDAGGLVQAFQGKILQVKDDRTRKEDREAPIERVAEVIRCPSCGKPYEGPKAKTTVTVVCDACGAALHLDDAEIRVVGKNPQKIPTFTFPIGLPVTIDEIRYEVMGRLLYEEIEEGISYTSVDYVLYNQQKGYLQLSEYKGHYTVGRIVHYRVVVPEWPEAKAKVQVGPDTFQFFESGTAVLKWVDGAVPWIAAVGERTEYSRLVKPPEYVDVEITGKERELIRGRYLTRKELASAIPEEVTLPDAIGVYSCQPYEPASWLPGIKPIAVAFTVFNILLFFYSLIAEKETVVLQEKVTAEQYIREYMTTPFQLRGERNILQLKGSASLNNSWIAMDFAVVDQLDRVLSDFSGDASYYHGVDSEGSWTEGERTFNSYFRIDQAGTYRLLIHGQGGSGIGGSPKNEELRITVTEGNTISWYFMLPLAACGLIIFLQPIQSHIFETKRWADVVDDDDS